MTFIEPPFAIFLALTYALWLLCRGRYGPTGALLLAASAIFYGYDCGTAGGGRSSCGEASTARICSRIGHGTRLRCRRD
jgi:hypothetical protein